MNSIVVSSIIFASVFVAALIGMALRRALPEDHVGSDAKEVVRLATALIATMAALVLGMLVSSAKSSYDARKNEIAEISTEIIAIDRLAAKYGPETGEIRAEFRQLVVAGLDRIWPSEASRQVDLRPGDHAEAVINQMELLAPKNDRQAAIKAQVVSMVISLRQTEWLLFLKMEQNAVPLPLLVVLVSWLAAMLFLKMEQNAVPLPLLVVLVSWLAAIFVGFGLFAPPNPTVVVTLALGAIAVSSAIFIILEMYTPFSGVMRIAPTPILDALSAMGR